MTRQQRNSLKRLDEKIAKAKANNDFIKVLKLTSERNKLFQLEVVETRVTLKEALSKYTPEERRKATAEVIYAVATADLLYGATMDVEETLKKQFGIDGLPLMVELRNIVKKLAAVVKTIDDVGIMSFSLNYADVVTDIETKYEATMKNYIHNEIMKASNKKGEKGL